jgi:UDP-glucose 6-dehydrogenase
MPDLEKKPKISVIGVGYVGLCTAVGLASKGYTVFACDIDEAKIGKINQGIPPFFEPGPEKLYESIQRKLAQLTTQTMQFQQTSLM